MKSVLKKMLILPIMLLIPVNILVIIVGYNNINTSAELLQNAVENHTNLIATQISKDMEEIDNYIYLYLESNEQFINLSYYEEKTTQNSDFYLDSIHTLNTMETLASIKPEIKSIFYTLSGSDKIWQRGTLSMELQTYIEEASQTSGSHSTYIIDPASAPAYIINCIYTPDAVIGYQFDLEPYTQQIYQDSVAPEQIWFGSSTEFEQIKDANTEKIIYSSQIEAPDIVLACIYNSDVLRSQLSPSLYIVLFMTILSIIIAPTIIYYYYQQIFVPTRDLHNGVQLIREGQVDYRVPVKKSSRNNEFIELTEYFNIMMDDMLEMKSNVYEMKLKQKEMQLTYYSQQIRPHFILNVLNMIYSYASDEWELAQSTILNLVEYFRYIVNVHRDFVPLVDEMNFLKNYLKIQKQRLDDYFIYSVSWEPSLDNALLPPFLLSTFVENSIKHGLADNRLNCIAVIITRADQMLCAKIVDSGYGFTDETLQALQTYIKERTSSPILGVGIINTIERLDMFYDSQAQISFYNDNGAVVEIHIPIKLEET